MDQGSIIDAYSTFDTAPSKMQHDYRKSGWEDPSLPIAYKN
jgi:hypothetical protein